MGWVGWDLIYEHRSPETKKIFAFSVLTLILIGYSFLLAVRVKMQKLSIEMELETKRANSSENGNLESIKSKVKKRSLPMTKVMAHPDSKVIVKRTFNKIPLQDNSS